MNHSTRNFSNIFIAFIAAIMLTSCAEKEAFTKSVVVPSADGQVKIKKDNNSNYAISISIRDLSPSKDLVPAKETYVVWSETANGTQNIGQLKSARSIIARGYKASLEAVSTTKPKRIFITAEDDAKIQYPGTQVVLTTDEF